jgi:hypothetical protein
MNLYLACLLEALGAELHVCFCRACFYHESVEPDIKLTIAVYSQGLKWK